MEPRGSFCKNSRRHGSYSSDSGSRKKLKAKVRVGLALFLCQRCKVGVAEGMHKPITCSPLINLPSNGTNVSFILFYFFTQQRNDLEKARRAGLPSNRWQGPTAKVYVRPSPTSVCLSVIVEDLVTLAIKWIDIFTEPGTELRVRGRLNPLFSQHSRERGLGSSSKSTVSSTRRRSWPQVSSHL